MPRLMCSATIAILLAVGPAIDAAPAPQGPTPEQIQKAVDDLGSGRFAVRERASRTLWEAGAAAEAALTVAATSADAETATRARTILDKFDWGLYPNTPPEIVKLIEEFRGGDAAVRQGTIGKFMKLKPSRFSTLRKLIAHEQEPEARKEMFLRMAGQAREAVPGLIVAGQLDEAGELLDICLSPSNSASMGDYATFQYLRGKVDMTTAGFEMLRLGAKGDEAKKYAEVLVYLYRVKKDWPAARRLAALVGDDELTDELAWESNDWTTLAAAAEKTAPGAVAGPGAAAAYYRMAGNKAKYEEKIGELRKELAGVEGNDGSAYLLAHSLLLNSRGADAIDVLKERPKHGAGLAFDLLCAQLKFKEAFAFADRAMKELETEEEAGFERSELAIHRGKALAALGETDSATQVFRGLLDQALAPKTDDEGSNVRDRDALAIVKAVARSGLSDLAVECAAKTLANFSKGDRIAFLPEILDPLFDEQKHIAVEWWLTVRIDKADADPVASLKRVMEIMEGKADRKQLDRLVDLLMKARALTAIQDGTRSTIFFRTPGIGDFAIAEAYRAAGVKDKAEAFYKKAVAAGSDGPPPIILTGEIDIVDANARPTNYEFLIRYADFLLGEKRHTDAAAIYRKAWDAAPQMPLPLYLQGHALTLAGDASGKKLREAAHWVPLGDERLRTLFSEDLAKRGFADDSRREMDIVLQAGWFRSYQVGNIYLRMARQLARQKDFEKAAVYAEKDVVGLFRTTAAFAENKAYLIVPELARSFRVRALLAAGKLDDALAEAKTSLAALPGNVDLAIALVPDLEKAGKKKEADELYTTVKTAYEAAIKDHGNSGDLRNSLAWTMVNCRRDLDAAVIHAQKAVDVTPKAAGYLDTLAEAYFRKENRPKALELMKKCAALEPTNPYYRKQLERFASKGFDSPLPDEETGDD